MKAVVVALLMLSLSETSFRNHRSDSSGGIKIDTVRTDTAVLNVASMAISELLTYTYPDSTEEYRLALNCYRYTATGWKLEQRFDTLEGTEYGGELKVRDLNFDGVDDLMLYYG